MRSLNLTSLVLAYYVSCCFILSVREAYAVDVSFAWDAPTTNVDGTPLTDLGGYEIHFGLSSRTYTLPPHDVGNVITASVPIEQPGTYYAAVRAYDIAGNQSQFSNEIIVTVHSNSTFSITLALETGVVAGRNFEIEIFDSSTSNLLLSDTMTADLQGQVTISSSDFPGVITIRIKSAGYLARAISDWEVSAALSFPSLLAGDLDNNNIINSSDWALMDANWFGTQTADLNGDGVVNTADRSFLSANWFLIGD